MPVPSTVHRTPVGVIVDGYSVGKYLPAAFRRLGADVVHLQSTPAFLDSVPPPDLRPYRANVVQDAADPGRTAKELAAYGPCGVLPGQETGVPPADRMAELLGLPGNPSATSALRRDKYRMIEALRAAGIRCADQLKSSDPDEVLAWARTTGYPVVVKPLSSASTDKVSVCRGPDEARAAVTEVLGSHDIFGRHNTEVLVQSFLDGAEYIVDIVRGPDGGRRVCGVWRYEKTLIGSRPVYDKDVLLDPGAPPVAPLVAYLDTVLDALDIRFGAAHAEIMMTTAGPALVEVGARLDGLMDPGHHDSCLDGNQADLLALACVRPEEYARRYPGDTMYRKHREGMVMHVQTARSGVVEAVDEAALARITALDTVHLAVPRLAPGDRMRPTTDLLSSPLRVFLTGDTPEELLADHARIRRLADDVFRLAPQ
ncbi:MULTISPECIES: ATP-grasp domain-containing protein [unclassified Streptomyces]|uniref:ATP-grasp domain-containing protein n=1 Tax=unclassified Streptomyces TaxID=2593676 RepID=UPI002E12D67F|nr:ATP-grasp domain-containing protein [Streptomyces sp. NBC_01296]WSW57627.1 ATP-grasp domain-containing protein [Streptomyces sp. NBC_00998]